MENLRRIAALLIALCLALPQRSCVNGGQIQVHYPLSNIDSPLAIIAIAALFTLPLLLLLVPRVRMASLLGGIAVAGAGLYYVSYWAYTIGTTMMVGWYLYTGSAATYLFASLVQAWREWSSRTRAAPAGDVDNPKT